MTYWRATMAVTRWEFQRYIKWKQQIVGMLVTMVVVGAFVVLPRLNDGDDDRVRTIAVIGDDVLPVSNAGAGEYTFVAHPHSDEQLLRDAVNDEVFDGLLIVHTPDDVELVLRREADWAGGVHALVTSARREQMIASAGLSRDQVENILAPPALEVSYTATGAGEGRGGRLTVSIVISLMLFTVFVGMSYIFASITGEKQIRVTEQVISAIRPQAWTDGKILGLMLVSLMGVLVQVVAFAAVFLISRAMFGGDPMTLPQSLGDPGTIVLILLFAVFGLFFWFAFFGAIAATIDDPQHSARGSFLMLPVFATVLAYMVPGSPDSGLSRFLSLFPATSPAAMPARMMTSDVATIEIAVSLLLLAAGIVLLRTVAGRIFRMAMLMYGKEPSWAEMRRWIFQR